MASHALTCTISALPEDLLREIFLRLPDLPSLARAAFACRAFLHAVRSSPAFRRRFRQLHAPPLIALFLFPRMQAFVPAAARRGVDPAIAAAFSNLLRDDDGSSEWGTQSQIPYFQGKIFFVNRRTEQSAFYNPHTLALTIFPKLSNGRTITFLEFHTLPPDDQDDQRPSRVVCVHRDSSWARVRVAVFSSHTKEWRSSFPESRTTDGTRSLFWVHSRQYDIIALNTATFQFSRMDVPPPLRDPHSRLFKLGRTKDGTLCIVHVENCTLSVWFWTADYGGGIGKFVLHKMFPLHTIVKDIVKDNVDVGEVLTVIDGFVYLSVVYAMELQSSEWFLSFCLETEEVNFLFKKKRRFHCPVDPYIMTSWPPSLMHNTKVSMSMLYV
jgi:hypothetical protein